MVHEGGGGGSKKPKILCTWFIDAPYNWELRASHSGNENITDLLSKVHVRML